MKTFASVLAVGTLSLFGICDLCPPSALAGTAARASTQPLTTAAQAVEQKTVTLRIGGMTCGGCAIATRKVLARLPGVSHVQVCYEEKRAIVTYDPARVTVEQMIAAAETLGYAATVIPEEA